AQVTDRTRQQLDEAVDRASFNENPRASTAVLPCVAEDRERRSGGGGLEVSVGEDDVRRLAVELERDTLDRPCGELPDPPADGRRAGECDLRHVRMLDQPLAHDAPGS